MNTVDIAHLQQWIGKTQTDRDVLAPRHARLMAATLGLRPADLVDGTALRPLWHWIYFLNGEPPAALGRDGHPARGAFLPPVPLSNRMWAGGDVEFVASVPLGAEVEKRSSVVSVEHKIGKSGELVFVRVLHEFTHAGETVIREFHDIVYKDASRSASANAALTMPQPQQVRAVKPDSTMLFRYSALTFNGHRIHYDADYCREVEGYTNLVIHGPLIATLLAGFAEELGQRRLRTFKYRGMQPSVLGNELQLNAAFEGDTLLVWASLPNGTVSMRAEASF